MQGTVSILALLLLATGVEATLLRNGGKPAKDEMEGFGLSFEIKNYDYFGLTNEWSDPWAEEAEGPTVPAGTSSTGKDGGKKADPVDKVIDKLDGMVDKTFKPFGKDAAFLQLGTRECWRPSDALVQQIIESESSPLTLMDAMRTAIKTAIEGAIGCEKDGGEKKKSLLAIEADPKKGKKDKADTKEEKKPVHSNMHVTFRPGTEEPNLSLLSESQRTPMLNKPRASLISSRSTVAKRHWSVIVDVTFTDHPKNGVSDLKMTQKYLKKALISGQLKDSLRGAIYEVTADAPDIRRIETEIKPIKQWNVDKCEKHISNIVNTFTLHYTRAQVPMALYNECTNFMPKMSFSRDHILDSVDATRCRRATRAFKKLWKFGKNAKPKDFQLMCLEACEAKYGKGAPLCHVTEGKKLKGQKKL